MSDVYEAFTSRIKSPVFGFYIFSILAINWKAVFILLISNKAPIERINDFETTTSFVLLFVYPFLLSSLITIAYPWITYIYSYLCSKPTILKNTLQAEAEHALISKKLELEEKRSHLLTTKENIIIDQAKRDESVEEINDDLLKEKVKKEIESLRTELEPKLNANKIVDLKQDDINSLMAMAEKYRIQASQDATSFEDKSKFTKMARELEDKAHKLLIKNTSA